MRCFATCTAAVAAMLASTVSGSVQQSDASYDYVVVGGGTSGLVVANRLSEDPNISVLIIEAGDSQFDNPNVTDTTRIGSIFGSELDWQFKTVEQKFGDGRTQTMRAAKALGGTSTMNGMAYTRTESAEIDAWEKVGNVGWNWSNLFPYYRKSETFQTPSEARRVASNLTYDPSLHGYGGPLKTGWVYGQSNDSVHSILNDTYQSLGVPWNKDINGGNLVGFTVLPRTIDQEKNIRGDAAQAYYYPYQNRTNLKVLLNAQAQRLVWQSNNSSAAIAYGVEVEVAGNQTYTVGVKKEVILSAGALVSPQLLELSGVGNPAILNQHDIETVVDLPTVGENLQDQMLNELAFNSTNITVKGELAGVAFLAASNLFGNESEAIGGALKEALPGYAARISAANENVTSVSDLLEFFNIQWELLFQSKVPVAEILLFPGEGMWSSSFWGSLPLSRGNVHIGNNSINNAVINPNFYLAEWDLFSQAQGARFIRKLYQTAPLSNYVLGEIAPGAAIGADASINDWGRFLKATYRSNFHGVGTAAMMPREKGGVVDINLKVYGTSNVRVVDASVIPFQICGHTTGTLYAVSERAADIIKAANNAY